MIEEEQNIIEHMQRTIDLLGSKLEYYQDIAEKHFHSPKEKYGLVDLNDGNIISAKELQKEINALRSYHTQITKRNRENEIVIEEEKTLINIKKYKNERRFLKLYYVSLRNKTNDLDALTIGLLQKLIQYIRTDGSNGLIGSAVKSEWYKTTNIPKGTFDKHFKILEENNITKFIRNQGIFINPYYARYGNEIEPSTLEMFNLEFDGLDGLREVNKISL